MEWFYDANGQQAGPVSDSQLADLARTGAVTPQTLVWRHGMAQWQPYAAVAPANTPATTDAGATLCIECGQAFPVTEMVADDKAFVCAGCKPVFFQKLKEGVAVGAARLWRTPKDLVMAKEATLPDRCVKCHAPATGERLKRNLYWHPPWIYILILASLLIYVIVALIIRKRATIHIGLCDEHRAARRNAIALGWGILLAGIGTIIAAISFSSGWAGLTGGVLIIAGTIYGSVRGRVVSAARIDDQHLWLRGVCPAFLDTLPEWTGKR